MNIGTLGLEQSLADLALFVLGDEYSFRRRAKSRAKFVLRIDSGSFRRSSPSSARMSKAYI